MAWAEERFPRSEGEPEAAHQRSLKAKALDLLRGLLPAGSLSHMGIYATGQAYEQLLLRLHSSPLPEARETGRMILSELQQVVPSFVARVDRPDRGGEWAAYLEERAQAASRWAARLGLDRERSADSGGPTVRLVEARGTRGRPARRAAVRGGLVLGGGGAPRGAQPPPRRARDDAGRAGRRARQPPLPPRPRLRGAQLPLRGGLRLRRLPRPPAPPPAHRPVADAGARARAPACPTSWSRPAWPTPTARAWSARARSTSAWWRRAARAGPLRAVPGVPDPLRARHERARGDAPGRAALGPRGPPRPTARSLTNARRDRGASTPRWPPR